MVFLGTLKIYVTRIWKMIGNLVFFSNYSQGPKVQSSQVLVSMDLYNANSECINSTFRKTPI